MTECEKLRNDLKAFLDGQLSPASRIALRLHLNRCESCRRELEGMRLLGTDLRAADNLEMSDALRSRILASVPTTPPPAAVKMLPKWREKPVMIWGASASAALAWFLLYPAISDYQNHLVPQGQKAMANTGKINVDIGSHVQDSDDSSMQAVKPSDKTPNVHVRWGNNVFGKANTGKFRNPIDQASANTGIRNGMPLAYFAREEDPSAVAADGHTKYFRSSNGLWSLAHPGASGGGKDAVDQLDVLAGGTSPERSDRRYVAPSQSLLEEGVQNNSNIPKSTPKQYEKIETDPSRSSQSAAVYNDMVKSGQGQLSTLDNLPTERQVHKDANLTVEVANTEQQSEAVERLVKESKGYVAQNQLTTVEDNTRQATLTCKVPVDQFDTVMGQLARLGLLKGKTLSGEDITDKVSDEQETGHVLRADIATTEEKLKERKRHSDVVRDEETLRQLRIRVAQSQARLKMLNKLGALSEITVELDEKPKDAAPAVVKPTNPFLEEVSNTGQAAAHTFVMALRLPVQLLVWIVVYSPLWALLYFGYRRFTR